MANNISDDNFIKIEDDYAEYIDYLKLIFTDYFMIVEKFDSVIENELFDGKVYLELTGTIRYASKRVFPLLLAFFGQDEQFEDDLYPEFMEIQLMVLYLFDKLQYEMDEIVLKWDYNNAIIDEDIINLEAVNYLLKVILEQLTLFAKVFDVKIEQVKGSITVEEFERKMIEIHDSMFI